MLPDGADAPAVPTPADARLGRFHPAVADRISELLYRRGIEHAREADANGVRILVDRAWRDDLRAELTMTWAEVTRHLPDEQVSDLLGADGPYPGWYDAPRGGHVDREGRLVVASGDEEEPADEARVVGPALITAGAILLVTGWYVFDSAGIVAAGVALAIAGLVLPR